MKTAKPVLLSGTQPTGRLHIGNYLGALKNWVELQNSGKYFCYFPVVDLHSLTEGFDPDQQRKQIMEVTADLTAGGLDPKKSVIFQQSQISAHSELAWILNTITAMGELERMTQFKDKAERQKENINVGLFDYPVLMAADIILYDVQVVPVGEDQLQHLELTRTLARKFNTKFGETFTEPKALLTETPRVMSLKNPAKKMSKSIPEGCLFLDDSPEEIKAKVKAAVTDSGSEITYDENKKPAISNLLEIYGGLSGETIASLEKKFKKSSYSEFKNDLAELVADYFTDFRKKKKELMAKPQELTKVLREGSEQAAEQANKKILEVKQKVGLI